MNKEKCAVKSVALLSPGGATWWRWAAPGTPRSSPAPSVRRCWTRGASSRRGAPSTALSATTTDTLPTVPSAKRRSPGWVEAPVRPRPRTEPRNWCNGRRSWWNKAQGSFFSVFYRKSCTRWRWPTMFSASSVLPARIRSGTRPSTWRRGSPTVRKVRMLSHVVTSFPTFF